MKSSNDVTNDHNDGMNFDEFSNQVDTQKEPATLASKEVINSTDEKMFGQEISPWMRSQVT